MLHPGFAPCVVSCEALAKDDISVQHEAEKGFSDPAASQAPEVGLVGERGGRLNMTLPVTEYRVTIVVAKNQF